MCSTMPTWEQFYYSYIESPPNKIKQNQKQQQNYCYLWWNEPKATRKQQNHQTTHTHACLLASGPFRLNYIPPKKQQQKTTHTKQNNNKKPNKNPNFFVSSAINARNGINHVTCACVASVRLWSHAVTLSHESRTAECGRIRISSRCPSEWNTQTWQENIPSSSPIIPSTWEHAS